MKSDHAGHVRRYMRQRAFRSPEMLRPRRCDACGEPICCYYGQIAVTDSSAPGGVRLLHPRCVDPHGRYTGMKTGDSQ